MIPLRQHRQRATRPKYALLSNSICLDGKGGILTLDGGILKGGILMVGMVGF